MGAEEHRKGNRRGEGKKFTCSVNSEACGASGRAHTTQIPAAFSKSLFDRRNYRPSTLYVP